MIVSSLVLLWVVVGAIVLMRPTSQPDESAPLPGATTATPASTADPRSDPDAWKAFRERYLELGSEAEYQEAVRNR